MVVLSSAREGILAILRRKAAIDDLMIVYSLNGEKIASRRAPGRINCIKFDTTQYKFIAGGANGLLFKFNLITLESHNLLRMLSDTCKELKSLTEPPDNNILSLEVINHPTHQQLYLGMSSGKLLLYERIIKNCTKTLFE